MLIISFYTEIKKEGEYLQIVAQVPQISVLNFYLLYAPGCFKSTLNAPGPNWTQHHLLINANCSIVLKLFSFPSNSIFSSGQRHFLLGSCISLLSHGLNSSRFFSHHFPIPYAALYLPYTTPPHLKFKVLILPECPPPISLMGQTPVSLAKSYYWREIFTVKLLLPCHHYTLSILALILLTVLYLVFRLLFLKKCNHDPPTFSRELKNILFGPNNHQELAPCSPFNLISY